MLKPQPLKEFWEDKATLKEVKDFLLAQLADQAIEKAFGREDTVHLADAKEAIEKAWSKLDEFFSKEPLQNQTNEAR